ncbi:protein of unknown function with TPD sequence-motif, partial [Kipferlia bialata]
VAGFLTPRGEYGHLSEARSAEIESSIEGMGMTLEQAKSLRRALLRQKVMRCHKRLQSFAPRLMGYYAHGESIVSIARRYDFPPINTFRAILVASGCTKAEVKRALQDPETYLSERDQNQLKRAIEEDTVTQIDQSGMAEHADLFETILCDYFTEQGVRFRTQAELLAEQTKVPGGVVCTPDLLLLDHVTINGHPVSWVDAKCFYGADLSIPRGKTQKQADRYVKHWGQGALVYRRGFCSALHIDGAVLLDSTPLDLQELERHHAENIHSRQE